MKRADDSFSAMLRWLLEQMRALNRELRGHDPYTPEPPPRDPETGERIEDWRYWA